MTTPNKEKDMLCNSQLKKKVASMNPFLLYAMVSARHDGYQIICT